MQASIRTRLVLLGLATAAWLAPGTIAGQAPQDPLQLPRVQAGDVRYLGSFLLPADDGTGRSRAESALTWGGYGLGLGPDGTSLYFGCHDWGSRLARVTIPELGEVASIVEPCTPVRNLEAINPGDTNGIKLGGSLWWNRRLIVSAYAYYDGGNTARATHFAGANLSSLAGPVRVGQDFPGMIGGFMGIIPPAWRALLGGPALTGMCCTSIIYRSSYGPSVSVFNPDHVGTRSSIPSTMLLSYPDEHRTLGEWDGTGPYFNGTTKVGGLAFPDGTRSVLFVERHGTTFCYGPATADKAVVGRPDGYGNTWCFDPTETDKGVYGFPYKHLVLAYDAVDLLAVKNGELAPWDVKPYATWPLTDMSSGGVATMRAAAYDPATRRWYVVEKGSDDTPRVHVYEIAVPAPESRQPDDPPGEGPGEGPGEPGRQPCDDDGDGVIDGRCTSTSQASAAGGVWSRDRVLDGGAIGAPAIAACGASVHVAQGSAALYYRRSQTEGATWHEWALLGDGTLASGTPLACDGATVVLTAHRGLRPMDAEPGAPQVGDVWTWVSADGGATWRLPVKVSSSGGADLNVSSVVHGPHVEVLWTERRGRGPGTWEIRLRESVDGGRSWGQDMRLAAGATPAGIAHPALAAVGDDLLAAWTSLDGGSAACLGNDVEMRAPCAGVYVKRRTGGEWGPGIRIASARDAEGPSVALSGEAVVLTYARVDGAGQTVAVVRSADRGATWGPPMVLDGNAGAAAATSLASGSGRVTGGWRATRAGRETSVLRGSLDGGVTWAAEELPFEAATDAPLVAHSTAFVHVVARPRESSGPLHYARRRLGS